MRKIMYERALFVLQKKKKKKKKTSNSHIFIEKEVFD